MGYKLQDLIDIDHFQNLQDRLNKIYSFPSSIIDNDGNILTATAWQEVCTQFHRKNKEAEQCCIQSDLYIKKHIHEANPALIYRCPHGLMDAATPIIIDGAHYGNFFTGQFFLEKIPDPAFFRSRAQKYGFDETAYLSAVKQVPVWSQEQLDNALFFIRSLIEIIAESGLKKLREIKNREQIQISAQRNRAILKTALDGFWATSLDGRLVEVNDAYCRMSGYTETELLNLHISDLDVYETREQVIQHIQTVMTSGPERFESRHRKKDGTLFDLEISALFRPEHGGQCICFLRDITEHQIADFERESTVRMLEILNAKTDLKELMHALLLFMKGITGCDAAGIRLCHGDDYPYYEVSGFSDAFVAAETNLCMKNPGGQLVRDGAGNPVLKCMCGNVIRGRFDPSKPFFTEFGSFVTASTTKRLATTTAEDCQARIRNRCYGEGYKSVLLIPLRTGDKTFGLLQFNDRREGCFSEYLVTHLERMAGNITIALAHRESEKALQDSRDLLDTTQRIAHIGGWDWDVKQGAMTWTDETYRIHGMTPGNPRPGSPELIDQSLACYDLDDRPVILEAFHRCAEQGIAYDLEFPLTRVDGRRIWIQTIGNAVKQEEQVVKVVGNIMDITGRKQAEEEIARRELTLNKIFDLLPIGLWFADKNGKLLRGNPAGVEIWGAEPAVPMEEYGVFKARRLPSGEEIAPDNWALNHTIQKRMTISDELLEIDAFDGRKKIILNYTAPVINETGEMLGAIIVNNDITRLKQAEVEREKLLNQLSQKEKMESIGRLAGGVAHDFNNLLGVILGNTELAMLQTDIDHDLYSNLKEIQKAAQRSADLTKQLLTFARKDLISPRQLDLNDTVESRLNVLRRLIGDEIRLIWKPGTSLWPVKMDPSQIHQILSNLCVNARDAIGGAGAISIKTRKFSADKAFCTRQSDAVPGDYVMLSVSDNGCGMDKETLDNLFEPFFTTKGLGRGTGMGLATIYGIARQNCGFIDVHSEPAQGATFNIFLPRLSA